MSAPVVIHLMRHGAPEGAGRLLGRTDAAVTPAGISACLSAADGLAVEAVVTSDLVRASACAAPIAARLDVPLHSDARWRELDFGAWDGQDPAAIGAGAMSGFWADPDADPPPGGERWSALVARVGVALAGIAAPTLVVTHAGAMRAALAATCGFDHRQAWAFDLPYAARLSLRCWRGEAPAAQITGLVTCGG